MLETITIHTVFVEDGLAPTYRVDVQRSRADGSPQRATVFLEDQAPGLRVKDGPVARSVRLAIRRAVAQALGLTRQLVRAQASYSDLHMLPGGAAARCDATGRIVGQYGP